MQKFSRFTETAKRILKCGGVGVIPTDTLYGIVGSAFSKKAVERIYRLRRRNPKKPMIVLISSRGELARFGMRLDRETRKILTRYWPGKVSVILPLNRKPLAISHTLAYLHRGTKAVAFRLPAERSLRNFLHKTGPLVAPSANIEGKPPARTVSEARKCFGEKVDFYVDKGKKTGPPSTLIAIRGGKLRILRQGAVPAK